MQTPIEEKLLDKKMRAKDGRDGTIEVQFSGCLLMLRCRKCSVCTAWKERGRRSFQHEEKKFGDESRGVLVKGESMSIPYLPTDLHLICSRNRKWTLREHPFMSDPRKTSRCQSKWADIKMFETSIRR